MTKKFVCIAEAVAYYYSRGYEGEQVYNAKLERIMWRESDGTMVAIKSVGFLDVEARIA